MARAGTIHVRAGRRSRRSIVWLGGTAAAAAAVLLVVVVPRPGEPPPGARTREIEATGPVGFGFSPAAPPDGAEVRTDTLAFHWTAAGEGASYQITVSTEAGAIVWSEGTRDTSLALPSAVASRLEPGRTYYWQVDGVLPDLRSASTGLRRFIPDPR